MSAPDDVDVYRRTLLNLLIPPVAGLFVVTLLMAFLYWLSLGIFAETLPVSYLVLLDKLRYASAVVALTLVVAVATVLLAGLRTLDAFTNPLQRILELDPEVSPETLTRGRLWLYTKLRKRVIVLTVGCMGAAFFLLAGLYLLVLNHLFEASGFNLELVRRSLGVLRYYGTLVFFGLVLTGFFIIFVSLRQLRKITGVDSTDLRDVPGDYLEDVSLDRLEADLEKVLFSLRDSSDQSSDS